MFIITLENDGNTFYLRGTTWAFDRDRANLFETSEAAHVAIEKAKKFLAKKSLYKKIKVWPS